MTNEELKAKLESLTSITEAYELAKTDGFYGTIEDFATLCEKAAEAADQMNLDDMENVAGGSVLDTISGGFNTALNWVKENPALTAEIAGSVIGVVATGAVCYTAYKRSQATQAMRQHLNGQTTEITNTRILAEMNPNASFLSEPDMNSSFDSSDSGFDFSIHNGSMDTTLNETLGFN